MLDGIFIVAALLRFNHLYLYSEPILARYRASRMYAKICASLLLLMTGATTLAINISYGPSDHATLPASIVSCVATVCYFLLHHIEFR